MDPPRDRPRTRVLAVCNLPSLSFIPYSFLVILLATVQQRTWHLQKAALTGTLLRYNVYLRET